MLMYPLPQSITPEQALDQARALLHTNSAEHSSSTTNCQTCSNFWNAVTDTHADTDPETTLNDLYRKLPPQPHPDQHCTDCDGCRFELQQAMTTIALAKAGLHIDTAWGPGHPSDEPHPNDPHQCPICSQWVTLRANARIACAGADVDADRWLGPDDTPNRTHGT